jgi:hypothetical protein
VNATGILVHACVPVRDGGRVCSDLYQAKGWEKNWAWGKSRTEPKTDLRHVFLDPIGVGVLGNGSTMFWVGSLIADPSTGLGLVMGFARVPGLRTQTG